MPSGFDSGTRSSGRVISDCSGIDTSGDEGDFKLRVINPDDQIYLNSFPGDQQEEEAAFDHIRGICVTYLLHLFILT